MNRNFSGGKRAREMERDRKKKEKEERLRRNRELRAQGIDPGMDEDQALAEGAPPLETVNLEDIVVGVPTRPKTRGIGPMKLFVGGLSWQSNEQDVRTAFEPFGPVSEVIIVLDRNTGRSRGFGFVTFERAEDANNAIAKMNGAELDGRTLKVNRAEGR